ncbi:hypothetical protein ACFVU3_09580 [Streptomyces sp. NPDC058052]|uniref:hypothetical protein n=1 Tax=Streptomyces sp. NPDC058052 TaxID=3346316 RepID=UPI0036E5F95E
MIESGGGPTRVLTGRIHSVGPAARFGAFRGALDADGPRDLDRALIRKLGLF